MQYKTPSKEELNAQLIEAAKAGNIEDVKRLLEQGAEVDAQDYYRETAMMWAARKGHLKIIEFLVGKGADVNARNNYGWTAIMNAAWRGRVDVVEFLANKGVDVNVKNYNGETALMKAAFWGNSDNVRLLAEHGADPGVKNDEGKTAAMISREKGHKEVADYLDSYLNSLIRVKERIDSVGKNDGSGLALKPEIRDMLRIGKGQEYNVARHGVSYEL